MKFNTYLSFLMSDLWSTELKFVTKKFTFKIPLVFVPDTPWPVNAYLWVIYQILYLLFPYMMRSLNKSNNLCIAYLKHCRPIGILHDTQVTLDFSHFKHLSSIHSESAHILIVSQIQLKTSAYFNIRSPTILKS